ncbi:MAG: hypothetical protein QM757_36255, partial [Paludibaculum sp.]
NRPGNLDSENAVKILDLIVRLRQEQKITLILVTHDPGIARKAERVLEVRDGRIASDTRNAGVGV